MAKFSVSFKDCVIDNIIDTNKQQFKTSDVCKYQNLSIVSFCKKNVDAPNFVKDGDDYIYMVGTYMGGGKKPLAIMQNLLNTFSVDNIVSYKKEIAGMWCVLIHKNNRTYLFNDYYGLYDAFYTSDTVSTSLKDCVLSPGFDNEIEEFSYIMEMFQLGAFPGHTSFTKVRKLLGKQYIEFTDSVVVRDVVGDMSFHYRYNNESDSLKQLRHLLLKNASLITKTFGKASVFMTGGLDSRLVLSAFLKADSNFNCKYGCGNYTQPGDKQVVEQITKDYNLNYEELDWQVSNEDLILDKRELYKTIGFYNYIDSGSRHRHESFVKCSESTPFYSFGYFCEAIRLRDWAETKGKYFSLYDYVDNSYLNPDIKVFYKSYDKYREYVINEFKHQLNDLGVVDTFDKIPVDLFESFRWKMARFCDSRMEVVLNNYGYAFSLLSIPEIHELILSLPADIIRGGKFQSKLIYSIEPKLISSFDVFSHLRWYRIDKQFNKRKKITFVNVADSVLESIKWFKPMIMRIYRSYRYDTSNRFSREQQFCIDNKAFIPNFIDTASLTGALNRLTAFTIAMKERYENNNIRSYTS